MYTYEVEIKERGRDKVLTPSYSSSTKLSRMFLVNWFGLNEPDIEWYRIVEHED